jgi:hypothetical protein
MTNSSPGQGRPADPQAAATPILTGALRMGGLITLGIAVVACGLGYLVGGGSGLTSALIGAAFAALFMGLTAVIILIAGRVAGTEIVMFFGIIFGGWVIKLILFLVAALWLRTQSWLDPGVFGITLIVGVLGSLVVDVIVFQRSRVPYVTVSLPDDNKDSAQK